MMQKRGSCFLYKQSESTSYLSSLSEHRYYKSSKMDSKWLWVCIVLMLVSLEGWCSEGCWEQERFALLKLKHLLSSEFNNLENWVENSECCEQERVECNNKTGRVIKLDLGDLRSRELEKWYLNLSLFSPFEQVDEGLWQQN